RNRRKSKTSQPSGGLLSDLLFLRSRRLRTLGEKLLALRSASGRTLKEVSDELGLADGHLASIETGKISNPRASVVAALADYYGVDIGTLVKARQRLALSPETSAIVRLFEDKLT